MRNDPWIYIILCLSFIGYKLVEPSYPSIPFFHTYFEDILAIPIILKSALIIINNLSRRYIHYKIKGIDVLIILVFFSIYFEWYLPRVDQRFTADVFDILCYSIGAVFFALKMNQPITLNQLQSGVFWKPLDKS